MGDSPSLLRIKNRLVGYLYAGLYLSSDRLFVGASLLGWISAILFFGGLYLWLRSGIVAWFAVFLVILLVVRIAHRVAKRSGFIVFTNQIDDQLPSDLEPVKVNQKLELWASGIFSITGSEEYMFRRPARLWRLPFGDHALMVERPSGRYLYQFIERGFIERIKAGCLVYGSQVNPALEIDFRTTWGPAAGETDFNWFAPGDSAEPKRLRRKLYLGFEQEDDRNAIWRSLLLGREETD
jgi:hypothetical protein